MRGFPYLYGEDLALTKRVIRVCERVLEHAQFEEILAPAVVDLATIVGEFDRPVPPSHAGIVFSVQSVGGEQLVLSYENTIPICIFYANHCADVPPWVAKRFSYVSTHYRNETEVTAGQRIREFRQVGFEIIGGQSTETLPVAIETASLLLANLGLDHSIRVSDASVLSTAFKQLGIGPGERSVLRSPYDSGDRREFERFLSRTPLGAGQRVLLACLFSSRCATFEEMVELRELLRENGLEDLQARLARINDILARLPPAVRQRASIDPSLVRSERMYSGAVFQVYVQGEDHEVGGGGEYNRLMRAIGGRDVMACGAAFGLERITHTWKRHGNHLACEAEVLSQAPGR